MTFTVGPWPWVSVLEPAAQGAPRGSLRSPRVGLGYGLFAPIPP